MIIRAIRPWWLTLVGKLGPHSHHGHHGHLRLSNGQHGRHGLPGSHHHGSRSGSHHRSGRKSGKCGSHWKWQGHGRWHGHLARQACHVQAGHRMSHRDHGHGHWDLGWRRGRCKRYINIENTGNHGKNSNQVPIEAMAWAWAWWCALMLWAIVLCCWATDIAWATWAGVGPEEYLGSFARRSSKEMSSGGWMILEVADVVAIRAGFFSDELQFWTTNNEENCMWHYLIISLLSVCRKSGFSSGWRKKRSRGLTIRPRGLTAVYYRWGPRHSRYWRTPGGAENSNWKIIN